MDRFHRRRGMWEDWKFWPDRHVFTPMLKKNVAFGAHKQSKQIYYCPLERFPRGAKDPKKIELKG